MRTFDIDEHSTAVVKLDHPHGVSVKSNIWVKNSLNNTYLNSVSACLTFITGAVEVQTSVSIEKAQELIDLLQLHIETIKAAEIELLALQTKAAA